MYVVKTVLELDFNFSISFSIENSDRFLKRLIMNIFVNIEQMGFSCIKVHRECKADEDSR